MNDMPSWKDARLGSMKRVALWLVQEVGVGATFSKHRLREDFPDVAQIDRRMRDLRNFGWKILTNREDPSLDLHEQRFVEQGAAVWEPGKATRKPFSTVTAAQRHEVMMRDGHKCRSCGIGPGEKFHGTEITSQLDVARRSVKLPSGETEIQLVIECNRCRVGRRDLVADLGKLLKRVERLPTLEKRIFSAWVQEDQRSFSEIEDMWADYRTLPAEAREHVKDALS